MLCVFHVGPAFSYTLACDNHLMKLSFHTRWRIIFSMPPNRSERASARATRNKPNHKHTHHARESVCRSHNHTHTHTSAQVLPFTCARALCAPTPSLIYLLRACCMCECVCACACVVATYSISFVFKHTGRTHARFSARRLADRMRAQPFRTRIGYRLLCNGLRLLKYVHRDFIRTIFCAGVK